MGLEDSAVFLQSWSELGPKPPLPSCQYHTGVLDLEALENSIQEKIKITSDPATSTEPFYILSFKKHST